MINQHTQLADPVKSPDRLQEIARLHLHEYGNDAQLNKFVLKASREFHLPVCFVSVVLDDALKCLASCGFAGWIRETQSIPLEWTFCSTSVRTGTPFIVEDAASHSLVKDNPLVVIEGFRSYAGVPVISKNGYVLGNFCVFGTKERLFTQREIDKLRMYAIHVAA